MLEAGMEAPLGPERAEALTLTLVKGPCTTTWESTISPRAPESEIAEVDPGASVWPTRSRLGMTHTGKEAEVCWTPLPASEITAGEFVALLATDTLPLTLPAADGAKATFNVAVCPAAMTVPLDTPLSLKPAPLVAAPEIVTLEFPEFVSVTERVLLEPVFTFPKLKLAGLALS